MIRYAKQTRQKSLFLKAGEICSTLGSATVQPCIICTEITRCNNDLYLGLVVDYAFRLLLNRPLSETIVFVTALRFQSVSELKNGFHPNERQRS